MEVKLKEFVEDELDIIRDGKVLEPNTPYLIPLIERLHLPSDVRGKANPKSSTGRLDVLTRIITDESHRFDEIRPGIPAPSTSRSFLCLLRSASITSSH